MVPKHGMVTARISRWSLPKRSKARAVIKSARVESRPPESPSTAVLAPVCFSRFLRPQAASMRISSQVAARWCRIVRHEGHGGDGAGEGRLGEMPGEEDGFKAGGVGGEILHPPPLLDKAGNVNLRGNQAGFKALLGQNRAVFGDEIVAGEYQVGGGFAVSGAGVEVCRREPSRLSHAPAGGGRAPCRAPRCWPRDWQSPWRRPAPGGWTADRAPRDPRRSPRPARSRGVPGRRRAAWRRRAPFWPQSTISRVSAGAGAKWRFS